MIEKLGTRVAEFVGATATRVTKAAESVAGMEPKPSPVRRLAKVVVPAVAATAAAVAAGSAAVTRAADDKGKKPTTGQASRNRGPSSKTSTTKTAARKATKSAPAQAAKNGAKKTAEKTREELYELAKKADIPGRASMTKDELAKALKS